MSVDEYLLRMKAYSDRTQDEREWEYWKLWINERVVSATDKNGKYVVKQWSDFYRKPKTKDEKKQTFQRLHAIRRNLEKYRGKEETNE